MSIVYNTVKKKEKYFQIICDFNYLNLTHKVIQYV
jgi:hypothetical protein